MSVTIGSILKPMANRARSRRCRWRSAFTLVELLVSIVIIALLSGLVFGALQRAGSAAKIAHTKSTIAKLNASLMDRWDSYRSRRLPINPTQILGTIKATGGNAYPELQAAISAMSARRISASGGALTAYPPWPCEPLSIPWNASPVMVNGTLVDIFMDNQALKAAVRLCAIRETMKYEMPQGFADLVDFGVAPGANGWALRQTQVLPSPPPIANTYLSAINKAYLAGVSQNNILQNDSAECLYLILTLGSTDSGLFGEQLPTADVGDSDGDGLLEFQDAWPLALNSYTPKGQANAPIDFLRWAPGFVSDVQPNPTSPNISEFSLAHHDYFDPLKLDIPDPSTSAPRGFQLTPLIYSFGPDGIRGVDQSYGGPLDPYDSSSGIAGTTSAGSEDNITNHSLDTRIGK